MSFTWISRVLKGEPQGKVGESEELRRLAPSLLRQMWVSGESAREAGVKSSVTLHGGFNRHAVNRGFGASTEYFERTNGSIGELQERINHLEKVLDAWVWKTDDELADHAGLYLTVNKLAHRARWEPAIWSMFS